VQTTTCSNEKLVKCLFMLQMCRPASGWGALLEGGQIGTNTIPVPCKGDPRAVFSASRPLDPAGWIAALLLLAGDVESSPGPRTWTCSICAKTIQTKRQTSIRCNYADPHWIHLRCFNITAGQYTQGFICDMHASQHTAPPSDQPIFQPTGTQFRPE